MRIELQPAFVLHAKAYRDTSLIVDLLTPDYGRLAVVAKGARGRKGKSTKQQLTPFQPQLISCLGKGELKTLTAVEPAGVPLFLSGKNLYSALYLNELLMRLLLPMEPHPAIYDAYSRALGGLAEVSEAALEPLLRRFELLMLEELGYAPCFDTDAGSGEPMLAQQGYVFVAETGFVAADLSDSASPFLGEHLLAMSRLDFSDPGVRRAAKRFCRMALRALLGEKPLRSRELFAKPPGSGSI